MSRTAKELLCREVEGRRVRLTRTVQSRGGSIFKKGRVMLCTGHWRGKFNLTGLRRVKRAPGYYSKPYITGVGRWEFEVLP